MFKELSHWYMDKMEAGGYGLIAALMAVESSIVPLPSEVIIPPAAHLAYTGRSHLTVTGIIIAGTIGSWIGSSVMYWAARLAGRPLVKKYGRMVLVPENKLEGAERWTSHFGAAGIFISRLLPVVRHLVGIPAGIVRMNYGLFSLFTILGSAIWCGVLSYAGIKMGQDERLMQGQLRQVTLWLAGIALCLGAMYYFFVHRQMRRKPESEL